MKKVIIMRVIQVVVILFAVTASVGAAFLASKRSSRSDSSPTTAYEESGRRKPVFPDDTRELALQVSWHQKPQVVFEFAQYLEVFKSHLERAASPQLTVTLVEDAFGYSRPRSLWEVGIVASGPLKDAKIYLWSDRTSERDAYDLVVPYFYILRDQSGTVRLLRNSRYRTDAFLASLLVWTPNITFASLDPLPEQLSLRTGRRLYKTGFGGFKDAPFLLPSDYGYPLGGVVGETIDGRPVFESQHSPDIAGCVFVPAANGELYWYDSRIPTDETGYGYYSGDGRGNLQVTWKPGFENSDRYLPYPFVAGIHLENRCPKAVSVWELGPLSDLIEVGTTIEGDTVYAPKNPEQHPTTKDVYDNLFREYSAHDTSLPTINRFYNERPAAVIFWKNPFGQWIQYTSTSALPSPD